MIGRMSVSTILVFGATAFADPEPAPEFIKVTEWINSKPLTMADLKGRVVVVHFWTHGCINCIHNFPHLKKWTADFKEKDVTMIGIHTPETEREKDLDRIKKKVKDHSLSFPVAVDNDGANWSAWRNRYWPCAYLVDRKGAVRFHWEGELGKEGAAAMRKYIEELLAEGK